MTLDHLIAIGIHHDEPIQEIAERCAPEDVDDVMRRLYVAYLEGVVAFDGDGMLRRVK